jgi:hypothetical protein
VIKDRRQRDERRLSEGWQIGDVEEYDTDSGNRAKPMNAS